LASVSFDDVVASFGRSVRAKVGGAAVTGAPEDQLRAPLERLFSDLAAIIGLPAGHVIMIGEATLADKKSRPDYAVTVQGALVGFIEVKAIGKGADPRKFTDPHDKNQWTRLKSLPNLIYTDGQSFSLWRDGEIVGKVVHLDGDLEANKGTVTAPIDLLHQVKDFLGWSPLPPETPRRLAEISARLCRLLRDEVKDELDRGSSALTNLAAEWRQLLFPEANNVQFADGYAQAVTFGLLMARARNIPLSGGIDQAALSLRKSNSLIGTALRLLTDAPEIQDALSTALRTLTRVLDAVNWELLSKGNPEAWLYFYEEFLQIYDKALRKQTGSYYTPPEVVAAMVRLTDEALRDPALFNRPRGLASNDVTIADPATGTGTFLLGILRAIAAYVEADQGPGAVGPAIAAAANRLIGFELQLGPFAVAQLRLMAEMQALMGVGGQSNNVPLPHLYVTDTLGDPFATETQFSAMVAPIGESRRQANAVKRDTPITVVIGNPPYKIDAGGRGGWVESGGTGAKRPMDLWAPPAEWGIGAHAKHLKNLYVFFWRWATWKVFAPDLSETTGRPDEDRGGIVCYITVSGFLNGPGFQKMRAELRRDCSEIWIIDCSPEGHQPEVGTRIFQGVQHPVCIVLAARAPGKDRNAPATVRYRRLAEGRREAKFDELTALRLDDEDWQSVSPDWRASFLAARSGDWAEFPPLTDLFLTSTPGIKTHRTWVIAPDAGTLSIRWDTLRSEPDPEKKAKLFHSDDARSPHSVVRVPLGGHLTRSVPVAADTASVVPPIRFGFRSFDRQWIIPDHRLVSRARADLWSIHSLRQVHLTALDGNSPGIGPALSITELIPDNDHFRGSFGGRAFPLWRDAAATIPNIKPALLASLTTAFLRPVTPEDALAYIAALLAHPAFTVRFQADLRQPGLRVPMTANPDLFREATDIGRQVVWLHCYGERFADPANGRPAGPPRMTKGTGPTIPLNGAIPGAPESLPDDMRYEAATNRLHVGKGYIDNVSAAVAAYEVSGKNVLRQWFSYRKADRTRPVIGDRRPPSPLDRIQPDHWLPEYTEDLINLLHVLGRLVALEPAQADLLTRICAGPLIPTETLLNGADEAGGLERATDDRQADLFG
jgi:hypothetical protein